MSTSTTSLVSNGNSNIDCRNGNRRNSSSSSSSSDSDTTRDSSPSTPTPTPPNPSLSPSAFTPPSRFTRPHMTWPRSPTQFVKLPKDQHQLDAHPLRFHSGGSRSRGQSQSQSQNHSQTHSQSNNTHDKPFPSARSLGKREKEVRKREEQVGVREDEVGVREKRVWEGLREVARGKVQSAVLQARVKELEGVVQGVGGRRWRGRRGVEDVGAKCREREQERERGERRWWVKGWWSFGE